MDYLDDELFRIQAIRAAGLYGHPEANRLYAKAWEHGWKGGKEEVLHHLCDLADFILDKEQFVTWKGKIK